MQNLKLKKERNIKKMRDLLSKGYDLGDISFQLDITPATVNRYKKEIKQGDIKMKTTYEINETAEYLVYVGLCILTLGFAFFTRIIITQAIKQAK